MRDDFGHVDLATYKCVKNRIAGRIAENAFEPVM